LNNINPFASQKLFESLNNTLLYIFFGIKLSYDINHYMEFPSSG